MKLITYLFAIAAASVAVMAAPAPAEVPAPAEAPHLEARNPDVVAFAYPVRLYDLLQPQLSTASMRIAQPYALGNSDSSTELKGKPRTTTEFKPHHPQVHWGLSPFSYSPSLLSDFRKYRIGSFGFFPA
ncbi:hypothetical protein FQN57_005604 [Myotisia sp. PD_48]|nr:hypothetical protein FQN57_005604 [Myotisia sp. PD_48]